MKGSSPVARLGRHTDITMSERARLERDKYGLLRKQPIDDVVRRTACSLLGRRSGPLVAETSTCRAEGSRQGQRQTCLQCPYQLSAAHDGNNKLNCATNKTRHTVSPPNISKRTKVPLQARGSRPVPIPTPAVHTTSRAAEYHTPREPVNRLCIYLYLLELTNRIANYSEG
jgi:hypothetical protein